MKTTIEIELQPFTVPSFALPVQKPGKREEGMQETPKIDLTELDSLTIDRLCAEFRDSVFKKSGKQQPPQAG